MWFWFYVTPKKIAYYPWGVIYPQFGNHCYSLLMMHWAQHQGRAEEANGATAPGNQGIDIQREKINDSIY